MWFAKARKSTTCMTHPRAAQQNALLTDIYFQDYIDARASIVISYRREFHA
jgi:hypothetical protein